MSGEKPVHELKAHTLRWLELSLNGLVTFALLLATWFLATSEYGVAFRQQAGWQKVGIAALAGLLILLITHWFNLRARVEDQWLSLARTVAAIAPSLVKPALLVLLGAVLFAAYHVMKGDPEFAEQPILLVGMLGLSAAPALLTLGVSLLVERRMIRGDFAFEVNPSFLASLKHGAELVQHIQSNWEYEREIMEGSIHRMGRHAAILGFLASTIVVTCGAIIVTWGYYVALAVGTAATISFTLHLGQIFFRSASNDATARMMAWASRTLLIVSTSALFFGALLLESTMERTDRAAQAAAAVEAPAQEDEPRGAGNNPLRGRSGALLIGVAVALLGERMLRAVTNRAASLLGVEGLTAPQPGNLTVIDGLTEDDAARLAEERIDSIHALAFTPTPRIFFNTVYGLQRICDWQDQALLIERVGRTNALLLREQFFIRGAISARRLALRKFGREQAEAERGGDPAVQPAEGPVACGQPKAPEGESLPAPQLPESPPTYERKEESWLDLDKESHLDRALRSLMEDADIERLEVFWRSIPVVKLGLSK